MNLKRSTPLLLSLAAVLSVNAADVASSVPNSADAHAEFGLKLFGKLPATGNAIVSPQSVATALGMTSLGAGGDTAAAFQSTLYPGLAPEAYLSDARRVRDSLAKTPNEGLSIKMTNALWMQDGYAFKAPFLESCTRYYGAEPFRLDFANAADSSRVRINKWVGEQTNGMIKDLLPPRSITELTRMVLTNTIWFKGDWVTPFTKERTGDATFTKASGEKVTVPMMRGKESSFAYAENDLMQVVEMPYSGKRLCMTLLLPKAPNTEALEKKLAPAFLKQVLSSMNEEKVRVNLPRFKVETSQELSKPLTDMGLGVAFTPGKADFSGMNGVKDDLYIARVQHKAVVDVNETGTEAAAATAVIVATRAMPMSPLVNCNHPFLFLIRDRETGEILFLGRIDDPTAK